MGQQNVTKPAEAAEVRRFTRQIMNDMRAMEFMLTEGMFESGIHRVGAEQELFLIDKRYHPASLVEKVLALTDDPRLVNELTRFNLEINMDPYEFEGTCFSDMERDLNVLLAETRALAEQVGADIVMAGILPTIHAWICALRTWSTSPVTMRSTIPSWRSRGAPHNIIFGEPMSFSSTMTTS